MAYRRKSYTYWDGDAIFPIPFEYLEQDDILVFINDEQTTDFVIENTQVKLNNIPTEVPAIIKIVSATDIDKAIVDWENVSSLDEDNLILSDNQIRYAVQELYDNTEQFKIDINNTLSEVNEAARRINTTIETVNDAVSTTQEQALLATEQANLAKEQATASANYATQAQETAKQVENELQSKVDINDMVELNLLNAYVGQTVFSLDPLNEAGLHLYDGTVLNIGGIYDEFINRYIAELYVKAPHRFCTEDEWQATVNQYGVCGKYVYTAGVSVRLPRVTGFVEGTLDINALGEITEAGIPNITGYFQDGGNLHRTPIVGGAFAWEGKNGGASNNGAQNDGSIYNFDASRSSSVYKNDVTTVQPQSIKGYFYVVVATSAKTDIEVDIDNIVTDLNSKVDVSNMANAGSYIANCAMPSGKFVDLTLGATGTEYTAPANGWFVLGKSATATGQYMRLSSSSGVKIEIGASFNTQGLFCYIPVRKGDVMTPTYNLGGVTGEFKFFYAEGEVAE